MSSRQWEGPFNFFDCLLETVSFLDSADGDGLMDKGDVIDSMRSRAYLMIGKMLSHGVCTSMSLQGWDSAEADPATLEEGGCRARPARAPVTKQAGARAAQSLPTPWRRKALEQAHRAAMRIRPLKNGAGGKLRGR